MAPFGFFGKTISYYKERGLCDWEAKENIKRRHRRARTVYFFWGLLRLKGCSRAPVIIILIPLIIVVVVII